MNATGSAVQAKDGLKGVGVLADMVHEEYVHRMSSETYRVRVYRTEKGDTAAGSIVLLSEQSFTVYTYSAQQAETVICNDVLAGKLASDKVYQICPALTSPELIRSIIVSSDGSFERVFLDPAFGLYGESRRIRIATPAHVQA